MAHTYDLVVIGTGVAGGTAARAARRQGKTVAVADRGPFGGTCPLRGCEPKKVLYDITDSYVRA
ncbi:MAG: FAD-dependent oxidoreductase, partial [Desulfovibrionales bacterium]